jgi:hypothetical protein
MNDPFQHAGIGNHNVAWSMRVPNIFAMDIYEYIVVGLDCKAKSFVLCLSFSNHFISFIQLTNYYHLVEIDELCRSLSRFH